MRALIPALALLLAMIQPSTALADDFSADIDLAREALSRIHPGYDRFASASELDAMWRQLDARNADGLSEADLYLELSLILAAIRCDHTKAELPDILADARETRPVYLPFRFRVFDNRMFVDLPGETGLPRGAEILRIDGADVSERLDDTRRYIPVDGYTDHVRDLELAASSEFPGSGFDHFEALARPDDHQAVLDLRLPGGEETRMTVDRLTYPDYIALTRNGQVYRNFSDPGAVTVDHIAPGIAVLNVETFVNYRTPVDPDGVFGPVFASLEADGIERLILDLRRNGGGSTDAQLSLMRHLVQTPIRPVREVRVRSYDLDGLRPHLSTWEQAALNPDPAWFIPRDDGFFTLIPQLAGTGTDAPPAEQAFTGELAILTGPANSSGSTQIIGTLRQASDAVLVGEATGGSQVGPTAGIIYFLTLPQSGIRVRIPMQWSIMNVDNAVEGQGYAPDIAAPLTYESWMAGEDPALDAALDWARHDAARD